MSIINEPTNKHRYRCITETNNTIPHGQPTITKHKENKLQYLPNQKRLIRKQQSTNALYLQQYKPLKSQIICLGSAKEAASNNDELHKKKHRYLRYDASKQGNNKSMSSSLSKSKTASTESLRIHKMRPINIDKNKGIKDQDRLKLHLKQIKGQFLRLKDKVDRINEEQISNTKRCYNSLVNKNKQIATRIVINALKSLLRKRMQLGWNLALNYKAEHN